MGNSLGGKKTTTVMKINGETLKVKTPVKAEEVVKDYPGYVLLDSETVKHYGARAKPVQPEQSLGAKRLYFMVELPKECEPRRARSGIQMSAKERLESLMLSRRSASDLSILKPSGDWKDESGGGGTVRMKLRVPKTEVEKLVKESGNQGEAAEKIASLFMEKRMEDSRGATLRGDDNGGNKSDLGGFKARQKRVSFKGAQAGESDITVAS